MDNFCLLLPFQSLILLLSNLLLVVKITVAQALGLLWSLKECDLLPVTNNAIRYYLFAHINLLFLQHWQFNLK